MFDQFGQPTGGYGQNSPFQDTAPASTPGQPGRPRTSPLASAIAGPGLPPGAPAKVNPPAPPPSPLAPPSGTIHDYMLEQLKMGKDPAQVAADANKHFGRTTGNEAVYYKDNNTIGLPDSYLAGPTNRPDSPTEWNRVERSPERGHAGSNMGGGFLSMLLGGAPQQQQTVGLATSTGGISPLMSAVMGARQN